LPIKIPKDAVHKLATLIAPTRHTHTPARDRLTH